MRPMTQDKWCAVPWSSCVSYIWRGGFTYQRMACELSRLEGRWWGRGAEHNRLCLLKRAVIATCWRRNYSLIVVSAWRGLFYNDVEHFDFAIMLSQLGSTLQVIPYAGPPEARPKSNRKSTHPSSSTSALQLSAQRDTNASSGTVNQSCDSHVLGLVTTPESAKSTEPLPAIEVVGRPSCAADARMSSEACNMSTDDDRKIHPCKGSQGELQ